MDHQTHIRLLGEATGRGQQLELCTVQVLARALLVPEFKARLLGNGLGHGGVLMVLQGLVRARDCGQVKAEALGDWITTAKAAGEARNRVIHSPWISDGEGGVDSVIDRSNQRQERTQEELQADIQTITTAVARAADLMTSELSAQD